VRHEQNLDCGGAYIKLLPPGFDAKKFSGEDEYAIMFGPDVCGTSTRKTHAIFTYKGKNLLTKKNIRVETDNLSHRYTFVVDSDNTYEVRIDGSKVESGSLFDDWEFLGPKMIKDPEASKPEDWVDEAKIPNPEESKPEDWDNVPAKIPDPDTKQPEDWDEEEDGEWEAPLIDNPEFKGEWKPTMIDNPDFKGAWVHPEIENPDYVEDDKVYAVCNPCSAVGFELWQVKAGTVFDDIMVTDSEDELKAFEDETFNAKKDAEKAAYDAEKEAEREKAEAARKQAEAEKEAAEADEDAEDEDKDEL
jgi:calreticulin